MTIDIKKLKNKKLTYKLKHVFCDDPDCWSCAKGYGHGPYWHMSYENEGQVHTVFLGKEFNPFESDSKKNKKETQYCPPDPPISDEPAANIAENRIDLQSMLQPRPKPQKAPVNHTSDCPENQTINTPPPTKTDFEKDFRKLKMTFRADSMKNVYRKLIKKYHPDRYPDLAYINTWMAEINGWYDQHQRSLRH